MIVSVGRICVVVVVGVTASDGLMCVIHTVVVLVVIALRAVMVGGARSMCCLMVPSSFW